MNMLPESLPDAARASMIQAPGAGSTISQMTTLGNSSREDDVRSPAVASRPSGLVNLNDVSDSSRKKSRSRRSVPGTTSAWKVNDDPARTVSPSFVSSPLPSRRSVSSASVQNPSGIVRLNDRPPVSSATSSSSLASSGLTPGVVMLNIDQPEASMSASTGATFAISVSTSLSAALAVMR